MDIEYLKEQKEIVKQSKNPERKAYEAIRNQNKQEKPNTVYITKIMK